MEKYDIYKDMADRTGGDIYIGVVGPVRTGKSTFITKFMEQMVIPNIDNGLAKKIATDEMPQSADGKTIMTTQPKFVPAEAVKVSFKNKSSAKIKLIDCVGYFVEGAEGNTEDGRTRMVKTPWSKEEIPFEKAADIGTKKVIGEYSTVGVLITTDGSFGDIKRDNYVLAEEKTVKELKRLNKPFIIVLNSKEPNGSNAIKLATELEEKYGVPVINKSVIDMSVNDITEIMEKILFEFPMQSFNVEIPEWMQVLSNDNEYVDKILREVKTASQNVCKMKDFIEIAKLFADDNDFNSVEMQELKLGEGIAEYKVSAKDGLFYKALSKECEEEIDSEYKLMNFVKESADSKRKYAKIKDALLSAEETGYGVVAPTVNEMNLEEPTLVKQNGKYGVKLKANAPSFHIIKVDVETEVSPIVGTYKQGEDLVNYLLGQFEDNPQGIWETNMFGKSLHDLVNEGLFSKTNSMPKDVQEKMQKTLTRIVNEQHGGIICILL